MGEVYTDTTRPMLEKIPPQPSKKLKQYLATSSVSMGAFCAGTTLSWTSPALTHILVLNNTNTTNSTDSFTSSPGFTITHNESAIVGSMLTLGALISAIPVGYLADKYGRKVTVLSLSMLFLLNYVLLAFSVNLQMVIVARLLAGVGLGGICVVGPMYIGEITEASNRGTLVSFFQLFLASGILFACVVGSFTTWVGLAFLLGLPAIIFGASFVFMPESPVFLLSKNRVKEAEANLIELRGSVYNVAAELKEMDDQLMESQRKQASLKDLVADRGNLRALISVVGVLSFLQLSGINALVFYTVTIFEAAGTSISPFISAIIMNLAQVCVSYLATLVIEKAGRKFFLMLSSTGMMLCLAALGMFFHLKMLSINMGTFMSFLPLAATILFMCFLSLGYGPVTWMLLSELFAPEIKGIASGIGILANWGCAFLVTFSFPLLNVALGRHVTFYILAGIMASATVFVHYVVPETRGKSLAQIQQELNR
ncbi:unnamed protein product [Phaedon cochleariae]|uniref:Sugar transporter n=1 Tax=Phaedon cochleariae TaxID=80249 RepID=A0A9P0DV29_PHACE|nr:unnamed protein product [Phaedon cochleariae]